MQGRSNKSSILKEKTPKNNMSRRSEITSLGESGSRLNTSFDLDISMIESNYQRNLSLISTVTPIRSKIAEKKSKGKQEYAKKHYLIKVLINKKLNVRIALKKMDEIPTTLFRKGQNFELASQLVKKTKVTLQTSVMRTLLYGLSEQQKQPTSKLKFVNGNNIFVLPMSGEKNENKGYAVLKLQNLVKQNLKNIIRKFYCNRAQCLAIKRYLSKFLTNFVQKRKDSLLAWKMLPEEQLTSNFGQLQLNKLVSIAQKIQERALRLQTHAFNSIILNSEIREVKQQNIAKLILMCGKLRREQGFKLWKRVTFYTIQKEEQFAKVEQAKLNALNRIVQRSYFKLFKEINRRVYTIRKAAARIACNARISPQISFWRLLNNTRNNTN